MAERKPGGWRIYTFLTVILYGLWATVPKIIGGALGEREQQIVSTLGLLPVMFVLMRSRHLREGARPARGFWLAAVSGALTGAGNVLYYAAVSDGALSSITPIRSLYPLVTVILAAVFLKERWSRVQGFGILLSLAAMTLFNLSGGVALSKGFSPGLLVALGPLFLWGAAGILQKMASGDASSELNGVAFLATSVPMAGAMFLLPGHLQWHAPVSAYALAIVLGLLLGVGTLTILFAYRYGPAAIVTPISGLYWIVTVPIGIVAFHESVGPVQVIALVLTLGAVLALGIERRPPEG